MRRLRRWQYEVVEVITDGEFWIGMIIWICVGLIVGSFIVAFLSGVQ